MTGQSSERGDDTSLVFTRNGRSFCRIPELGILTSGETVQEAFDAARSERERLLALCREADIMDTLPAPSSGGTVSSAGGRSAGPAVGTSGTVVLRSDLRSFVIKTAIVIGALALLMLPVAFTISNAVETAAARLQIKGGAPLWQKIEKELARAARPSNDLPPEKQEELLRQLRVVVARVQPFTDVLAPIFGGGDESSCPANQRMSAPPSTRGPNPGSGG